MKLTRKSNAHIEATHRLWREQSATRAPVILVLDNIRSALNVGSIFRSADAFGCRELWLVGYTAQPPHRDILKTALGATDTVAWQHFATVADCMEALRQQGLQLWVLEQVEQSVPLQDWKPNPAGCAVVVGNEVNGVSADFLNEATGAIEIQQIGSKHSLNVAVAAGIVLWHTYLKLALAE